MKDNEYFVYILSCADDTLYTGITTEIERRLKEHNGVVSGGAKYAQYRRPVSLVFCKKFSNRSLASKEESRIKKLSKKHKIELIDSITNELKLVLK